MTKRARRIEKFLSDHLGWETGTGKYICKGCGETTYVKVNFCSNCGRKLPKKSERENVIEELEAAIKFALEEK